jgi:hypothetical protein
MFGAGRPGFGGGVGVGMLGQADALQAPIIDCISLIMACLLRWSRYLLVPVEMDA